MQNYTHQAFFPTQTHQKNFQLIVQKVILVLILAAIITGGSPNFLSTLPGVSFEGLVQGQQNASQENHRVINTQAATGRTILFKTGNGRAVNGLDSEGLMIPHLVLYANDSLVEPAARTIHLEISGIQVPQGGGNLAVKIETQHGDPDRGSLENYRISVFNQVIKLENNRERTQVEQEIQIEHIFTAFTPVNVPTPTGYYRVEAVFTPAAPGSITEQKFEKDFAFLLENQWVAPITGLMAQADHAAPAELGIYYMDMAPFQISAYRPDSRLARADIRPFVQDVLVPEMVAAIQHQTMDWGFHWADAWTSFRGGEDDERISVALTQTGLWYHGQAPAGGFATISINVKQTDLKTYDSLVDWILTIFSHELFHNQQRSINQSLGGTGVIAGEHEAWKFVTEGTAEVAASVYNPKLGFEPGTAEGPYFSRAKKFVAGGPNTGSSLNTSYTEISPYEATIYWRFLFEQCGGFQAGHEDPASGMVVIFKTLEELYADKDLLNIQPMEMSASLAELMDRVFSSRGICPFADFRSSLMAFHRAVYNLGFDQSNQASDLLAGITLYDPQNHLPGPEVASIRADGSPQVLADGIRGGYGVDFIEVQAAGTAGERGFTIEVTNTAGGAEVFAVQVLVLNEKDTDFIGPSLNRLVELGEIQAGEQVSSEFSGSQNGTGIIAAVLVSRVDGQEILNSSSSYRMVVTPR